MSILKLEIIIEQEKDKSVTQSPATFDELIRVVTFAHSVARDKYSYLKGQSNNNKVERATINKIERTSGRFSIGMQSQKSNKQRSNLEATSGVRDSPPTQQIPRQKSNQTSFKGKLAERGCFIREQTINL